MIGVSVPADTAVTISTAQAPTWACIDERLPHFAGVVGWEDVEVPAGKFTALKIEADG